MRKKPTDNEIVNKYAMYIMTDDPRPMLERFTALTRLVRMSINRPGANIMKWMQSPEATKFLEFAHKDLGVDRMNEYSEIGHRQFTSGEAAFIVQAELEAFAATLKGNKPTVFEQQRQKWEPGSKEQPRVIPRTLFLPKNRDEALRMIADALYDIDDENCMSDRHTYYSQEIRELLDLIERS